MNHVVTISKTLCCRFLIATLLFFTNSVVPMNFTSIATTYTSVTDWHHDDARTRLWL